MNLTKTYLHVPVVGRSALVSVSTVAGAWMKPRVMTLFLINKLASLKARLV